MSYPGSLAELLMAECDDRSRSERRIKAAALARDKSLRSFDANPHANPRRHPHSRHRRTRSRKGYRSA
jgi:hypothetical protein